MTTKQNKHKQRRKQFVSVLLVVALLISGIYAFLWSTDTKTNKFTVGKVDIELTETDWVEEDAVNILPGDTLAKNPQVINTGKNKAHVYLVVGMPVEDKSTIYTSDGSYGGIGTKDASDITVKAYGIQENYASETDSEDIWNAYIDKTGITNMFGELSTNTDDIEIFEFVELDTENWVQMDIPSEYDPDATGVYASDDGHNYYFFRYNNTDGNALLNIADENDDTANITPELFTGVKLIKNIGGEEPVFEELELGARLPKMTTYTSANDEMTLNAGEMMPLETYVGDVFTDGYYEYRLDEYYSWIHEDWNVIPEEHGMAYSSANNGGWSARVIDASLSSYPPVYSEINGIPVTNLIGTYSHTKIVELPAIPDSVINFSDMCYESKKLTTAILPKNFVYNESTFDLCYALENISINEENTKYDSRNNCNAIIETDTNTLMLGCINTVIPDTITTIKSNALNNLVGTYYDIYSGEKDIEITIPNSVTKISGDTRSFTNNILNDNIFTINMPYSLYKYILTELQKNASYNSSLINALPSYSKLNVSYACGCVVDRNDLQGCSVCYKCLNCCECPLCPCCGEIAGSENCRGCGGNWCPICHSCSNCCGWCKDCGNCAEHCTCITCDCCGNRNIRGICNCECKNVNYCVACHHYYCDTHACACNK